MVLPIAGPMGSAGSPVRLDPFQRITEVGWGGYIALVIRSHLTSQPAGTSTSDAFNPPPDPGVFSSGFVRSYGFLGEDVILQLVGGVYTWDGEIAIDLAGSMDAYKLAEGWVSIRQADLTLTGWPGPSEVQLDDWLFSCEGDPGTEFGVNVNGSSIPYPRWVAGSSVTPVGPRGPNLEIFDQGTDPAVEIRGQACETVTPNSSFDWADIPVTSDETGYRSVFSTINTHSLLMTNFVATYQGRRYGAVATKLSDFVADDPPAHYFDSQAAHQFPRSNGSGTLSILMKQLPASE